MGRFGRESFRPWVVSASLNIGAKSTYFCNIHELISLLENKVTNPGVHFHNVDDHKI